MLHLLKSFLAYLILDYSNWSICNTVKFNLTVFPLQQALKFPVRVGKRVTMHGLYKGCVQMTAKGPFVSQIGISQYPMYASKGQHTLIRMTKGSKLVLGRNVKIGSGSSIIITRGGKLTIGDEVFINQQVVLYSTMKVTIGSYVSIGWQSQIYDTDFHFRYDEHRHAISNNMAEVYIGNGAWITNRVTISKGSNVPAYAIIGSGSLVNKDFSAITSRGAFFAGSPACYKGLAGTRIINEDFQSSMFRHFIDSGNADMVCECEDYWFNDRYGIHKQECKNGGGKSVESRRLTPTKRAA